VAPVACCSSPFPQMPAPAPTAPGSPAGPSLPPSTVPVSTAARAEVSHRSSRSGAVSVLEHPANAELPCVNPVQRWKAQYQKQQLTFDARKATSCMGSTPSSFAPGAGAAPLPPPSGAGTISSPSRRRSSRVSPSGMTTPDAVCLRASEAPDPARAVAGPADCGAANSGRTPNGSEPWCCSPTSAGSSCDARLAGPACQWLACDAASHCST